MLTTNPSAQVAAKKLYEETAKNQTGIKNIKIRTLLKRFGYLKRSQESTAQITLLLKERTASNSFYR